MSDNAGPSGPSERELQGPSGPSERELQGPSGPSEREIQGKPYEHRPVMVAEVVELFGAVPPGLVVDTTAGAGGHARALLEAHDHITLLALDRDADAVDATRLRLASFGERASVRHADFGRLSTVLEQESGGQPLVGVLFDLGVSSPQLDRADRGFSYRQGGPLDMRMDRSQGTSAAEIVNTYPQERLAAVLADYGDERYAARIARAIVAARPLATTIELADAIAAAIPAPARRRGGNPARRSFQAIRIEVNRELEALPAALDTAIDQLVAGGRLVVLSYHSGEDRIVKRRFVEAATGGCECPPRLPCVCGATPVARLLRRGTRPSPGEVEVNRRSESARLRAIEKLPEVEEP